MLAAGPLWATRVLTLDNLPQKQALRFVYNMLILAFVFIVSLPAEAKSLRFICPICFIL